MTLITNFTSIGWMIMIHFVMDYCLVTDKMLESKSTGEKSGIMLHAFTHAFPTYFVMWFIWGHIYGVISFWVMLFTHFGIDYGKWWISSQDEDYVNTQKREFWILLGLDQFLHHVVILGVAQYCATSWYFAQQALKLM